MAILSQHIIRLRSVGGNVRRVTNFLTLQLDYPDSSFKAGRQERFITQIAGQVKTHRVSNRSTTLSGALAGVLLGFICTCAEPAEYSEKMPLGLPTFEDAGIPTVSPKLADLGKQLFVDKRLSATGKISCSSCHQLDRALTDGRPRAIGIDGIQGSRNAPSLYNVAYETTLFWDGRAATLESQVRAPLTNKSEHGLASDEQILAIIESDSNYRQRFLRDGRRIAIEDVISAFANYERTLLAGDSPFDRYYYQAKADAMSAAAIRGLDLFVGRARCSTCHLIEKSYALFTDQKFHASTIQLPANTAAGLPILTQKVLEAKKSKRPEAVDQLITSDSNISALGRFNSTLDPADIGKFKTPSLRNVAATGPYMHDGSISSLAEAIEMELYIRGSAMNYPIVLTEGEQRDILAFLESLTSSNAN